MCRYMRKPHSLKMREYVATVVEQCDDLKYFPDYTATDKFDDDELCDIVEFGSPPVWQNMMLIQGAICSVYKVFQIPSARELRATKFWLITLFHSNARGSSPTNSPLICA